MKEDGDEEEFKNCEHLDIAVRGARLGSGALYYGQSAVLVAGKLTSDSKLAS